MLTRLRAGARGDAGISLIEVVVAMTVTTVVGAMSLVFFVSAQADGYKSVLTNQAVADARNTLDSWTSLLRVAGWLDRSAQTDRFEEITPTKIVFYANLDNRASADQTTGPATKVVLLLRVTNQSLGEGQLVQIVFGPGNTAPASVRQVAFDVTPDGGRGQPIFAPYNEAGGAVDVTNTLGCAAGGVPQPGLCLQNPPSGAGLLDPQVGANSLAVSGGPLRGNPSLNVDTVLSTVAGVTVAFTATDPSGTAPVDFAGSASVNSGFPA